MIAVGIIQGFQLEFFLEILLSFFRGFILEFLQRFVLEFFLDFSRNSFLNSKFKSFWRDLCKILFLQSSRNGVLPCFLFLQELLLKVLMRTFQDCFTESSRILEILQEFLLEMLQKFFLGMLQDFLQKYQDLILKIIPGLVPIGITKRISE